MSHPLKTPGLVVLVALIAIAYSAWSDVSKNTNSDGALQNTGGMASGVPAAAQSGLPASQKIANAAARNAGGFAMLLPSGESRFVLLTREDELVAGTDKVDVFDRQLRRETTVDLGLVVKGKLATTQPAIGVALDKYAHTADLENRYVVQFTTPPAVDKLNLGVAAVRAQEYSVQTVQTTLTQDLARLSSTSGAALRASPADGVITTYSRIFSGASVRISNKKTLDAVKALSYVQAVYPDMPLQATINVSAPLIGANSLWSQDSTGSQCAKSLKPCITGKGIKIAIIDTGIDYTRPELGGCLGPQCKVIGGYDFVNNDADPKDDDGHGTHVAATAAGKDAAGKFNGVAPDASLVAYKVLDSGGSGSYSTVISGIERAIDPNQDGDYSDRADIISLSLGGPGSPDDPVASAVDAAVRAGAVVVVAAGNSGSALTIGTPAAARSAITVAASTKKGELAAYSSGGPVLSLGQIIVKPDVTAPGSSICAAGIPGYHPELQCTTNPNRVSLDGTSMATPHVSGAVALLKQAHPTWSSQQIKSALQSTAIPLLLYESQPTWLPSIWSQGAGKINVLNATNVSVFAIPGIINFGIVDNTSSGTVPGQVVLQNTNLYPVTYSIKLESPTYIYNYNRSTTPTVLTFPSAITVPANSTVTLSVSLGGLKSLASSYYSNALLLTTSTPGANNIRLPFFITVARLEVRANVLVNDMNRITVNYQYEPTTHKLEVTRPDGMIIALPLTANLFEPTGGVHWYSDYDPTGAPQGNYAVKLTSTYGNTVITRTTSFTYDSVPPTVSVVSDSSNNLIVTGASIAPHASSQTVIDSQLNFWGFGQGYDKNTIFVTPGGIYSMGSYSDDFSGTKKIQLFDITKTTASSLGNISLNYLQHAVSYDLLSLGTQGPFVFLSTLAYSDSVPPVTVVDMYRYDAATKSLLSVKQLYALSGSSQNSYQRIEGLAAYPEGSTTVRLFAIVNDVTIVPSGSGPLFDEIKFTYSISTAKTDTFGNILEPFKIIVTCGEFIEPYFTRDASGIMHLFCSGATTGTQYRTYDSTGTLGPVKIINGRSIKPVFAPTGAAYALSYDYNTYATTFGAFNPAALLYAPIATFDYDTNLLEVDHTGNAYVAYANASGAYVYRYDALKASGQLITMSQSDMDYYRHRITGIQIDTKQNLYIADVPNYCYFWCRNVGGDLVAQKYEFPSALSGTSHLAVRYDGILSRTTTDTYTIFPGSSIFGNVYVTDTAGNEFIAGFPLILQLTATPSIISTSGTSTLSWATSNGSTCIASDGWIGTYAATGSQQVTPTASTVYSLTCTLNGKSVAKSVMVHRVTNPSQGFVINSFTASPMSVAPGGTATLSWSSKPGSTCSGSWNNNQAVPNTGTAQVSLIKTYGYTLNCANGGNSESASVTITVTQNGGNCATNPSLCL